MTVLKSRLQSGDKNSWFFRNSLVVIQFVISTVLIVCTFSFARQLQYIQNKKLGFNQDYVVTATIGNRQLRENNESLKNDLIEHLWVADPTWESKTVDQNPMFFKLGVDFEYFDLYELEMAAGRKFVEDFGSDAEDAVILNETALKLTGWENLRLYEGITPTSPFWPQLKRHYQKNW